MIPTFRLAISQGTRLNLTFCVRDLTAITRASYADQLTVVRSMAERCTQDSSPKVQEPAGLLQGAADQMDAAFARRAEALVAELASYGQLQMQKLQAINTCRRIGYRLSELYPDERDRVRSYFRQVYRRPRPTVPTAVEPTPTTETAANAAPAGATPVLSLISANS